MKPNNWVSSSQATELLAKQLVTWPLAEKNYKALEAVQVKSFDTCAIQSRPYCFHRGQGRCPIPKRTQVLPMSREPAGGTGATAFRLSPSGIVQPLPDLPPAFHDPYPETYSATDIAAME